MEEPGGLVGLRDLHQDLLALEASRFRNVERLWADLEAHVNEFRQLLDKPAKNEKSRKLLSLEVVTLDEVEYSINDQFRETAAQLADTLDLDELESARLLIESGRNAKKLDRSKAALAIIHFHEHRLFLLECMRLLLRQSQDVEGTESVRDIARQLVGLILETKDGPARNGSLYTQKCLNAMVGIENWLQSLGERHQGNMALGQTTRTEYTDILEFQQASLAEQHESLGAIVTHLIKAGHTGVEDFNKLLDYLPKLDRWNSIAVHYVPMIIAFTAQFGSPDGGGVLRDARMLNSKILDNKDKAPWILRNLQAAMITWWLSEYSGWYLEQPTGSPVQNVNLEAEAQARSEAFSQALRDGAFECTLTICSHVIPEEWYDPARTGLVDLLLRDSVPLPSELPLYCTYFQQLLMEQLEAFADTFVANMPDTLRRFKLEEDDQRKKLRSGFSMDGVTEQTFHLERFLMIISFAFGHRADAAQAFWGDLDSNLYGFLQWASRRLSTPCVSAFCEMLSSISEGEESAGSAHRFLLEEGNAVAAKIRRSASLSWAQIFAELSLYTSKSREQPMADRSANDYRGKHNPADIDEPESAHMLESYLRLTTHLCGESAEVRSWIMTQPNFSILEVLFQLCNSAVPSRLQACAFKLIRSLLTEKSVEIGMAVWASLDHWVSGAFSHSFPRPPKATTPAAWAEEVTFSAIAGSFEQTCEFICLLQSLVSPAVPDTGLNDQLPFPETLGSAYRMAGIEPYIDFVFDRIFASRLPHGEDQLHHRIMTLNIMSLAALCLRTFNEDLVILANRSTAAVDEAMNTSSLLTYVRLHPFSRVMEWMFNDRVLCQLFASAEHDIEEVSSASPDSPLILGLLRTIEVMNLIFDLQSTYLDVVRPLIKLQSAGRRRPVLNLSLASFEDTVTLKIDLIVALGLYSGVGNQELTVGSLELLGKLASSRKLNVQATPGLNQRFYGNRLISAVEQHDDVDPIARSLCNAMEFDLREISQGPNAPGWTIKSVILDFLIHCLSVSPDTPTLAHALLGFSCKGTAVHVEEGSSFDERESLFHAVLHLAIEYPDGDRESLQAWALSMKQKGMQILSILWASPLTSLLTMHQLQADESLFALFLRQRTVEPHTVWDGRLIKESDFLYRESAEALEHYLWYRCSLFEYTSSAIRLAVGDGATSLVAKIFSTLLGSTSMPDGEQLPNPTVFDLFDFIELDFGGDISSPQLNYFAGLDFGISTGLGLQKPVESFDMKIVHEMVALRANELRKSGRFQDANEEQRAGEEAQRILHYFQTENSRRVLTFASSQTTKAWAELLILSIGTCVLDPAGKAALILQALQLITPKLEDYASTNVRQAIDVAKLILALLFQLDFEASALDRSRAGDVANDRIFQVFRIALRSVNRPNVDMQLREVLYKICYRYLGGMAVVSDAPIRRRHGIQTVRATGERTMDIVCDDAFGASAACRISALLLLDSLAGMAKVDKSNYIVDCLVRTNFLQVLVESIESIPRELRQTNAKDIPILLSYYETKLSLLLSISQSRSGAVHVMNSGLFQAVRGSGLFSVDPDIGVEIDNPEALAKYYRLLLSIARVITSVVLSRGPQNEQSIESAKAFLTENRPLVVSMFKRQARIGGVSFDDAGVDIEELVELFMLLIAMTNFLDVGYAS
ncbi:MAG: hypothetical protein ALECFALPRED_004119 [Alectoria fallacina]|uniref:Nuclear pore complex protein Nup205 n=1 Tax=Alectoria fallacina TaxID=1903189 RepID=A0A8H3FPA9_9LECA|nr:MAG: hypothetical protein ALECFALPRED_004119 [Alectoria fallacina]